MFAGMAAEWRRLVTPDGATEWSMVNHRHAEQNRPRHSEYKIKDPCKSTDGGSPMVMIVVLFLFNGYMVGMY